MYFAYLFNIGDMKKNSLLLFLSIFTLVAQGAVPTGYYYYARGKNKAALKTTLKNISTPMKLLYYGSGEGYTWQGFYNTDRNSDNTVKDMYSGVARSYNGYNSVAEMAIEHSFPKSWWGGYENMAFKDLFHLYPADASTNSNKNNLPLGVASSDIFFNNGVSKIGTNSFGTVYSGNCFEPADEYKGDFARSYLYISTIYENMENLWQSPMLTNTTYPVWQPWAIDLLLKWSSEDPVSNKERDRNDAIYAIQNNRNPFIDHPELAEYIWGKDTTNFFDYPAETGAFLIAPRRMTRLDFGVILVDVVKTMSLTIQGVNISAPLTFSFAKQSSSLTTNVTSITPEEALNGYTLYIVDFNPHITGEVLDTLLISGGGMTEITRIPVNATATSTFIVTEPTDVTSISANLHWLEDPQATDYRLSLYQGDLQAGNVIISGYYEGASNDKAIEIYNGTGATVNLSELMLKKQTNGAGEYVTSMKLSGTLQNNKTYLIVYHTSTNDALRAKANVFTDSIAAFNGNDAVALFRNGVAIDVVGKLNGGADNFWGENKILKRKSEITHPSMRFNTSEWNEYPYENLSIMGTHTMNLSTASTYILQNVSTGMSNHFSVDKLSPQQLYTYHVTSYRGGTTISSINTMQIKTDDLEIPLALEATDINPTNFTANWDKSLYADSYYLDVYQLLGKEITDTEEFNSIGGNGTPLPDSWSGTTSGNYTTASSSGQNPPSIAFKSTGEWLQTKSFPDIINSLSFMYKYQSGGVGSYLKVELQNESGWIKLDSIPYENNTKAMKSYTIRRDDNCKSIKFTYHKVAGNLALDDVGITHGMADTAFVIKNEKVYETNKQIVGLEENNTYFYRVRANHTASTSAYSEEIRVTTLKTDIENTVNQRYKLAITRQGVVISGLKRDKIIHLYSPTGIKMKSVQTNAPITTISIENRGIYIIQICSGSKTDTYKIVK